MCRVLCKAEFAEIDGSEPDYAAESLLCTTRMEKS